MSLEIIALAADHAGWELKDQLGAVIRATGRETLDLGTNGPESVDYPDFAARLAEAIRSGKAQRGLLVCGSGIGIGIAANRFQGIRAATCNEATMARLSRAHNDANVLALGSRVVGFEVAVDCLKAFLDTPFDGGERHCRRLTKMG